MLGLAEDYSWGDTPSGSSEETAPKRWGKSQFIYDLARGYMKSSIHLGKDYC